MLTFGLEFHHTTQHQFGENCLCGGAFKLGQALSQRFSDKLRGASAACHADIIVVDVNPPMLGSGQQPYGSRGLCDQVPQTMTLQICFRSQLSGLERHGSLIRGYR